MLWLLVIALLWASPSWGAIAEVGSGSQRATKVDDNVNTASQAYPGNVTANSLLVCGGGVWNASLPTVQVAGSLNGSFTVLSVAQGTGRYFLAYKIASGGGAETITVTPSTTSGNYHAWSCDEFSGVDTATPLDVDGGSATGSSTTPSDGLTTATANALLLGVMGHVTANTSITPNGSYTQIGEEENASLHTAFNLVFRIVTTAQAYTIDWTTGTSVTWGVYTAGFKEAATVMSGCRLLQNGTDKRLLQNGSDGRILQGGGDCELGGGAAVVPVRMLMGVGL